VRVPEVTLWIYCVQDAIRSARKLSRGVVLEPPQQIHGRVDPVARRRQLLRQIEEARLWLTSSQVGGLLWIHSIVEATVGHGVMDAAAIQREVGALLNHATLKARPRGRRAVIHVADELTAPVPCDPLPSADQREARLLPGSCRPRAEAVELVRPRARRAQVAQAEGPGAAPRSLPVRVRGVPKDGHDPGGKRGGSRRAAV
jgi:hypothetical protein